MYTAIHTKDGELAFDTTAYLRRHDIVYGRPALKPYEGLALGNGRAGGLVYHTANSLCMQINHAEAIDYSADENFSAWAWEAEEKNTSPFSCGTMQISSSLPLFDWVYQQSFEERLSLAQGMIACQGRTDFAELTYKLFFSKEAECLVLEFDLQQREAVELTLRFDKWGSPSFFHHYEQIVNTQTRGLDGTSVSVGTDYGVLTHTAGGSRSQMLAVLQGTTYDVARLSSHAFELRLSAAREHRFRLLLHVSAHRHDKPSENKETLAESLRNTDCGALETKHTETWATFWSQSFVHIDDDYLENLYYLHLYQMNSSSQGHLPCTFGGLWTWFKDSRNWGHFYHWNHQQSYWGLLAAGHPELMENYLAYRFAMLENAKRDAVAVHHANGAFFSDISSLHGYQAIEPDTARNFTVGAQIAGDFYRYWSYTQDEAFLRDKAIPMILAAFALYDAMLEKQQDGVWRIRGGSTCYESYWNLKETLTDFAAIRYLIQIMRAIGDHLAVDEAFWAHLDDIQQNLFSCPTETIDTDEGPLVIFAAGRDWDGSIVPYGQGNYPYSPFPATLLSPIYPFDIVWPETERDEYSRIARDTVRYLLHQDVYALGKLGCSGHTPSPQAAARMGLKEEMPRLLTHFAQTYQCFPNGLMHYADLSKNQQWDSVDHPRVLPPDVSQTQWDKLHDKSDGFRTKIDSEWFLHCYFEAAANLFDGIHEMLVSSCQGVIRVFPAHDTQKHALFKLRVPGGFEVVSECEGGRFLYIAILSTQNATCRIELPWRGEVAVTCGGAQQSHNSTDGILSFDCDKGQRYLIFPASLPPETLYENGYPYYINQRTKHYGRVQIGLDSIYEGAPGNVSD